MEVTPTTQLAASQASNSLSQLGEDYTRFLTLLTAQIQNQDPLAPMDSTQFVSQLAQLSQVEQAVKANTNLEALSSQISVLAAVAGTDMIGRDVTVSSSRVTLKDGATDAFYMLPEGATNVTAEIRDPLDRVVRKLTNLPSTAGELVALDWDGRDESGQQVLDGAYSVTVTAVDDRGEPVTAYTYRKAVVEEALFSEGQLFYGLNGDETVPSAAVLSAS